MNNLTHQPLTNLFEPPPTHTPRQQVRRPLGSLSVLHPPQERREMFEVAQPPAISYAGEGAWDQEAWDQGAWDALQREISMDQVRSREDMDPYNRDQKRHDRALQNTSRRKRKLQEDICRRRENERNIRHSSRVKKRRVLKRQSTRGKKASRIKPKRQNGSKKRKGVKTRYVQGKKKKKK
tara:strand:+ start:7397 stop:7936 length:540 start_codon:yes stop_codon:yes gene_type:complete